MIAAPITGAFLGAWNDQRQLRQQEKLQKMQIKGQKEMTDYNTKKGLEMWDKTNYEAQVKHLEGAGLNKGLIYGGSSGGGATASVSGGNVTGGQAPSGGGEIAGAYDILSKTALLNAQKDLIEAQTEKTKADKEYVQGPQTANTKMDTTKKDQEQMSVGLDNAMKQWLQTGDDPESPVKISDNVGGKMAIAELNKMIADGKMSVDENKRKELMNSAEIKKIEEEIRLMKKKGLTETQIFENLKKDGTLKDAEIKWNEFGLTKETLGQLVLGIFKRIGGK